MDNVQNNIDKIYTVLELNTEVRNVIKTQFSDNVWVCGEIQGLRPDRDKRHTYFELVQKDQESDIIVAKVKLALFAGRKPLIYKRIQETEGAFELKNDIEVKFLCEVSLHPPTGQYSLVIVDIDTVYTLGKVAQNRLKIIEDLRKQGLLEKNKLYQIPDIPLNIGLITAYDSAAYHDFINELKISGYAFKVYALNCHMQGKQVQEDVVGALDLFSHFPKSKLDIVVITRGGGSIADLSYFDNKKIAESIANSNFPVISAIGHQINTSIADMVAHTFCKTPTKAAQFLVEKVKLVVENLDYLRGEILEKADSFIRDKKTELQNITTKIDSTVSKYFRFHREELINVQHKIINAAKLNLVGEKEFIKRSSSILSLGLDKLFKNLKSSLEHKEGKVKILNPKNILRRGYSITYKGKKAVKSIKGIEAGDVIKTILYDGEVISEVK